MVDATRACVVVALTLMGGVGMFTFAELAHLVAATQLRSRGHMLDASALMGCLGWGGVGMFTFAELAHMVDATQHVS